MLAQQILKVFYAPHKVFKEIAETPKYAGPIIIMILFIIANIGFGYVFLSKSYVEQINPKLDETDKWTKDIPNWSSNASITTNLNDYINGTYYGNKSIEFSIANSSQIWAQLTIQAFLNGTIPEDYTLFSFRLKQLEPSPKPSNASLYLISTASSSFYHNLTSQLNSTGVWSNVTLSLGPASEDWQPRNNPDWSNITGLKFELEWPTSLNITLLIDGIFFHGIYKSVIEQGAQNLLAYPINAFIEFAIQWIALGVFLFLVPKLFKATTTWKPLLTVAGFIEVSLVMESIFFTVALLLSPNFLYSLQIMGGVAGESEMAIAQAFGSVSTALWYIERAIYVWGIVLSTLAMRSIFAFSWMKAILVSALAYLFSVLAFNILFYGVIGV